MQTGDRTLPGLARVGWIASWKDNVLAGANIGGEYGKVVFDEDSDVNFDGMVDISDLTLMGGNKMISLLKLILLGNPDSSRSKFWLD